MKHTIIEYAQMISVVAIISSLCFIPELYKHYYKLVLEPLVIETLKENE